MIPLRPTSPDPQARSRSNRRQFAGLCFGFLAGFVLLDQLLSRAPLAHVYGSRNGVLRKWELFQGSKQTPDVVFLGASYEMCGIRPDVIDDAVRVRLGEPTFSLNLAASSSSLLVQSLLAERILESGRLPSLLYLGVSPPAVDDTLTHWMADGLRALGRASDVVRLVAAPAPVLLEGLRTTLFASYTRWDDYRLMVRLSAMGAPLDPHRKLVVDERGWANWTGGINLPHELENRPASNEPTFEAISEPGFDAGNVNGSALRHCVRRLRDAGVKVRLVEVPHHSISRPRADPAKNLAYRNFVDSLVTELQVPLARPPVELIGDGDFFDEWHLHAEGAAKYSTWLAEDVVRGLRDVTMARPPGTPTSDVTSASRTPRSTEVFHR